ncbi:MAG: AmmeMemoRadiSam system radical SAM enzyme [Clostridiales bacterium]|nr:AmmeMemoRadiSam system radical SAM enzyme [Clostridiales bacterium]MCF8022422.1 AmmeMemoRadiSam system radical SAM enzyme [Clostridiales bacterium]
MHEAMFYEKDNNKTFCRLCPKLCTISEGKTGFCRVRKNIDGVLYSLNFGECAAMAMDPVEKKPLYHFYPGCSMLSVGTFGCNLHCGFCQNWQLAHGDPGTRYISPQQLAETAAAYSAEENCAGVAYTYAEPLMWYEYIYEASKAVREKGLKNVLVTNGYINPGPLQELLPLIDAVNIDLKAFTEEFYKSTCAGTLEPVMRTVELAAPACHLELTTLLITGLNDSENEVRELASWVASIDPDIPLHLSRYFPNYKMEREATSLSTLKRARDTAAEKLNYVYIGNAPSLDNSDTYCPHCGKMLVKRKGMNTQVKALNGNKCANCSKEINLVGID